MVVAQIDIFNGAKIYEAIFNFKNSEPLNKHFNDFGIGDMNFLPNSSSLILPILVAMFIQQIICWSLHKCAVYGYTFSCWRWIGVRIYPL